MAWHGTHPPTHRGDTTPPRHRTHKPSLTDDYCNCYYRDDCDCCLIIIIHYFLIDYSCLEQSLVTMSTASPNRASKRRRRKPSNFSAAQAFDSDAGQQIRAALANSRADVPRGCRRNDPSLLALPAAPTFFPTLEEFSEKSPIEYINKIRPIAELYGICKIVPPAGWDPPFCVDMTSTKTIETKKQNLHRLQEGLHFEDGEDYTPALYLKYASELAMKWKAAHYKNNGENEKEAQTETLNNNSTSNAQSISQSDDKGRDVDDTKEQEETPRAEVSDGAKSGGLGPTTDRAEAPHPQPTSTLEVEAYDHPKREEMSAENLERDYWDIVETQFCRMSVEYGNDVDTSEFLSGFPFSRRGRSLIKSLNNDEASPNSNIDSKTLPVVDLTEEGENEGGATEGGSKNIEDADPHYFPKFGTEEFYRETYWNLNNIPSAPGSILRHVKAQINGINVPWLYFGCLFSTFCWHNEDNYLYSINYHHQGAPKQWYGVPGTKKDSDSLERVFRSFLAMKMTEQPDLLHHITTMISPRLLKQGNVPVYKLLQNAGEFVVTFPRAFHGGFSLGPNIGEAVNFATPDWITYGADANERYRQFSRPAVFSHDRLAFTLANHVEDMSLRCCENLVDELRRITDEEIRLRSKLLDMGVRDVSDQIQLPRNRLDQLDEQSADYDDKRLCCHCKHVCFFSAVACECSHSRVSCLRHSHLMCKCRNEHMYLMVWCSEIEMTRTLERVETVCAALKRKEVKESKNKNRDAVACASDEVPVTSVPSAATSNINQSSRSLIAPGAIKSWMTHHGGGSKAQFPSP
jgi:hypothetical protein